MKILRKTVMDRGRRFRWDTIAAKRARKRVMARILVIEDEEKMSRALKRVLGGEGHVVEIAVDGRDGLSRALEDSFDLLIVDWMLPGRSGVQVLRGLRAAEIETPSLMLTAKGQIEDRVEGLDAGADDYLPKPFALQELLARVRALTRRTGAASRPETALRVGDIALDPTRHTVHRGEEPVTLTAKEFALLATLMQSPGRIFSRSVLLDTVWGVPGEVSTSVVELYVSYLRKKLDQDGEPSRIRTVRGVGYTFEPSA
jgi:two-component system OmpR family response regulator